MGVDEPGQHHAAINVDDANRDVLVEGELLPTRLRRSRTRK